MPGKTLTRRDLSEAVHRETGLTLGESEQLVKRVVQLLTGALIEEKKLKISSFATFSVESTPMRIGRNPKTREAAVITPRYRLKFMPSQYMKQRVAARDCPPKEMLTEDEILMLTANVVNLTGGQDRMAEKKDDPRG